ncbi:MAG: Uma2 family endonuclease [Chloroflexota bacterium]
MALQIEHLPVEEFDKFALLPENADKLYEYIGGEIVEVVSNNLSSEIAGLILMFVGLFVRQHDLGRVTGADGGYRVSGERYIPDVGFISKIKQPEPSREAYNPNPPDLAVEVLSPGNDERDMRIKIVNYLRAGTTVWLVDPDNQAVEVYSPKAPPKTLGIDHMLEGGDVLPGFTLAVKDIFPV